MSTEEAHTWCKELVKGIPCVETSAKDGEHIDKAFDLILEEILTKTSE